MRCAESTRLVILTVLLVSCSGSRADQPGRSRAPQTEHPTNRAQFALSFQPGTEGTDLVIRRAQRDIESNPAQADGYVRLARGFLKKRRETADPVYLAYAKDAIAAAQQISPRDPDVIALDIMASFDAHEFSSAAARARELIELAPSNPTGHLLLGDAVLELGEYESAVDAYQQAMDLLPDLRSYSRAAYVRWLHGDYDGSLELWEDALQSASPHDPEPVAWCYTELGRLLLSRGNAEGALRSAANADALVAGYLPALVLRGRALGRLGRTSEAIDALEAAVARQPNAETLLLLSDQLARAGRTGDAAEQLARAERQAEHDPLPLALYYARRGTKTERALRLATAARQDRNSVWAKDALALASLRAGDLAAAREAIDSALALNTPDARMHLHRGLIAAAGGDVATATAALRTARAIDPDADPMLEAELTAAIEDGGDNAVAARTTP